ncbi:MAG: cyclic nucleotide-binding protein [Thalassobius sp.]|nr:cyclic nucleotide-binding protein [Thalassovita sp.]
MYYAKLKEALNQIAPVEECAWNDLEQFLSTKTVRKGELLWKAGDICRQLVFVNKGLIRSFSLIKEKENTHHFYFENSLFYDDYSFISHKKCTKNYEAVETTDLSIVPRGALYLLFDKYKSFERIGRLAVEQIHVKLIENYERINLYTAEENYLHLIDAYPEILQRVPLKHIASYLNISAEHLSRIRKAVSKNDGN